MREFVVILFVIAVLLALTALRYRKQIAAVYRFWDALKTAHNDRRGEINEPVEQESGPLVNCAKCGMWVPESKAIRLGTRNFYCSSACFERAAKTA
jgi:hypothetical protein